MIPNPDSINIDKLGKGGTIITDTCNAAQKVYRLFVECINGTMNEQDCMQHLRKVWTNGVAKAVNKYMSDFLEENLDEVASFLSFPEFGSRDPRLPQRVWPDCQLSERPRQEIQKLDDQALPKRVFDACQASIG